MMSDPIPEPVTVATNGNHEEDKHSTNIGGINVDTTTTGSCETPSAVVVAAAVVAAAAAGPAQDATASDPQKPLSKNQLKKKRKWEQAMLVKQRRKQQEKEIKLAKAQKEGRDMDAERKEAEERRQQGDGWARRNDNWLAKFQEANAQLLAQQGATLTTTPFEICIDCSFEKSMSAKEINSLASQIRYCYASNKRAKYPTTVRVTSLTGSTLEQLQKVSGMDRWSHRAFYHTPQSIFQAYAPTMIDAMKKQRERPQFCYLTGDSDTVLETLQDNTIYIIGGIVDRNRLKHATLDRAQSLGMVTAKLPLAEYCTIGTTKVLTCNHVFDILLKYREHGGDWKKAFLESLPNRKEVSGKQEEQEKEEAGGIAGLNAIDNIDDDHTGEGKDEKADDEDGQVTKAPKIAETTNVNSDS
jgi:tRNA (guanine9-N1)-methyltransferase